MARPVSRRVAAAAVSALAAARERDRYTVDAVAKALDVLRIVAEAPDLGVSEIALRAAETKARTFRLLRTLEASGYVVCSEPARKYRLGTGAVVLGHAAAKQVEIVQVAAPVLRGLGQRFDETVQLSVRDGDDTICIANWLPERALHVQGRIGRRRAMHAGSSKALFAFTEPEFQDRILARSLQRYTERTIVDPGQVRTVLAKIRRDGFYVSRGEVSPDLVSVAAPVFGAGGAVVAQINIAAPASRMPPSRVKDAIAEVRAAASVLTGLLGGEQGR